MFPRNILSDFLLKFLCILTVSCGCSGSENRSFDLAILWEDYDSEWASEINATLQAWSGLCLAQNTSLRMEILPLHDYFQAETQLFRHIQTSNMTVVLPSTCVVLESLGGLSALAGRPVFVLPSFSCHLPHSTPSFNHHVTKMDDFVSMVRDVIASLRWRHMVIYHDQSREAYISALLHSDIFVKMKVVNVSHTSGDRLLDMMTSFYRGSPDVNCFLVLCDLDNSINVMRQVGKLEERVKRQGLISYFSEWLFLAPPANWTELSFHGKFARNIAVVVERLDVTQQTILEFLGSHLFTLTSQVKRYMAGDFSEAGPGDVITVPHLCKTCPFYDIYGASGNEVNDTSRRHFAGVGAWRQSDGLTLTSDFFPCKRHAFNGKVLHVATQEYFPFVMKNSTGQYSGYCIEMLQALAHELNFTYTIYQPPAGSKALTRSGLVNLLAQKKVDLLVAPLAVTWKREMLVDFTYAFYEDYFTVLYPRTDPESMKWRLYVEPFKWPVWACVMLSVFLSGPVLVIVRRASAFYPRHQKMTGLGNFQAACLYTMGALFQQGSVYDPKAWSSRFVAGFWWIYCVVVVAVYTGNLIAFLTVSLEFPPFKTVLEMVAHKGFQYGFIGDSVLGELMESTQTQQSATDMLRHLWTNIRAFNTSDPSILSRDLDFHISRVLSNDNYAFIGDSTSLKVALGHHCGRLDMLDEKLWTVEYAVALQEGSTYRDLFSQLIFQFHGSGLLDIWKTRHWRDFNSSCGTSTAVANPVNLTDMQGPFYVLFTALAICVTALLIETYCSKRKLKRSVTPSKDPISVEKPPLTDRTLSDVAINDMFVPTLVTHQPKAPKAPKAKLKLKKKKRSKSPRNVNQKRKEASEESPPTPIFAVTSPFETDDTTLTPVS